MRSVIRLLALLVAVTASAIAAHADTYQFVLSTSIGETFTFDLPSSPVPYYVEDDCCFDPVENEFTAGFDVFFIDSGGFVFSTYTPPYFNADFGSGPELFTGTASDPTLILGTFSLAGVYDVDNSGVLTTPPITAVLVVTDLTTSPIPEPSTLTLFGTGIVALAGVTRRRFLSSWKSRGISQR